MSRLRHAFSLMALSASEHVLFAAEAEAFVRELQQMGLAAVGSDKWSVQRERLEKLGLQAVINVSQGTDEFVKTFLTSYNKVVVLIYELLVIDVWKNHIFPLLFNQSITPSTSFPTYLVIYHEATLVGLLEVALFYQEVCDGLDETVLDLIDYCYRKVTGLVASWDREKKEESNTQKTIQEELEEQKETVDYGVQIKCLSLIHYISNHLNSFPLSVSTRLLNTHDFPCLLVDIIQISPWTKIGTKGEILKYEDSKWSEINEVDRVKVTKVEGQVWLTLYRLLLDEVGQSKYEFTSHRKECLLKLRGYLNDPLLEQIPPLATLQRYLHQLSLMEPPAPSTGLILEQVPVLYDQLLQEGKGRWDDIAAKQSKLLLEPDPDKLKTQATRWIDNYNLDLLETLMDGPPKCSQCNKEATKRCSRCRNEWYCCRECQVKNWKKHKPSCDLMHQALQQS